MPAPDEQNATANDVMLELNRMLEVGEIGLENLVTVVLMHNATDAQAYAAYAVLTAWLAMNERDKYDAALEMLRPAMLVNHPAVMQAETVGDVQAVAALRELKRLWQEQNEPARHV